jgi:CRISPR-associated protein Cas8a1/Csx13
MAKVKTGPVAGTLAVALGDPGMTPMLRAGLGGVAASLRAVLRQAQPNAEWPSRVPLGPGSASVEKRRVVFDFGGSPSDTLQALFSAAMRIREPLGVVDLPGTYEATRPPDEPLAVALQNALKRTFLQHGKSTTKAGEMRVVNSTIDEQQLIFRVQPYAAFAHQGAWKDVIEAIERGDVDLAGWFYPGAAERHIGFSGRTKCSYSSGLALSACFSLAGCLSYLLPENGGAIVIPEPTDLVRFAEVRPHLTPRAMTEVHVSGAGDATLTVALALRMEELAARQSVGATHAVVLRKTAWDTKQKYRVATITVGDVDERVLSQYDVAVRTLAPRIVPRKAAKAGNGEQDSFFVAASLLRGLITQNLAEKRPWFADFAQLREPIYPAEKKGLIAMLDHLEVAQHALVKSVHIALRQRFGAIASENDNPVTMRNRFNGERDKWRFAFLGAKTLDQLRASLAELWSRAGTNEELRRHWPEVVRLLGPSNWRQARDLALVALASYEGQDQTEEERQS